MLCGVVSTKICDVVNELEYELAKFAMKQSLRGRKDFTGSHDVTDGQKNFNSDPKKTKNPRQQRPTVNQTPSNTQKLF